MHTLSERLRAIDGRGYKAYKALRGSYRFPDYRLLIDHVQGDPFAEPSRIRLQVSADVARLPASTWSVESRRVALEDFLCRALARAIAAMAKGRRGSGHSGEIRIATCGQQVLIRDAVRVQEGRIEARLGLALPAAGRRILAGEAQQMLFEELPRIVTAALCYPNLDDVRLAAHLDLAEDQSYLRAWLADSGLVAFVGDGARLPRRSGIDDRPLGAHAVALQAPESLAVRVTLPHAGEVRGLGVPRGVTLIVGGGFHGKSTLLQALERGVYDHIPGDGREWVISDPSAVKIRAEDGRSVTRLDISSFINNLPLGQSTADFSTDNASGSTSQAANILEALCAGSRLLLIDEDTSATNFMIRDRRMQQLVAPAQEPITPLIARVRELYQQHGVSTVLVTGGSSAYFDVADRVILMDHYQASDVTAQARALPAPAAEAQPHGPGADWPGSGLHSPFNAQRRLTPGAPSRRERPAKIQAFGCDQLRLGDERLDLGRVEQLVEPGQLRAIGYLLRQLLESPARDDAPLLHKLQGALEDATRQGLESLSPYSEPHGGLVLPRLQELNAALNRLRGLQIALPPNHLFQRIC